MNLRTIIVITLAMVCGISSAVGVAQLRQQGPTTTIETTPVLVAKANVPRGRMVTADMLEISNWPKDFAPEHAMTSIEDAIDRATITPLAAGEPIADGKLAPKNSGRGLAALVPKGMRAYTIQTSRVASGVAGFSLPGNKVDVLLSLKSNPNDQAGGGSTTALLQAVEILAVDQRLDAPAENKVDPSDLGSVTLLVNPDQASLLDLGQSMGALTLSLRNLEDNDETVTKPATLADIKTWAQQVTAVVQPKVEEKKEEPKEEKAPVVFEIRTLRGKHAGRVMVSR